MLKTRPMMVGKSYTDIDYCKYGMPYRKRTRLWNNILHLFWKPRPLCKRDCDNMRPGTKRHMQVAQRAPQKADADVQQRFKQSELYRVPEQLVYEILTFVNPITHVIVYTQDLETNVAVVDL